jgi:ribokinase
LPLLLADNIERQAINMSKKIVVVGSINLDLVTYVPRMPAVGETITGNDFATYPGGKGANQAVAAARLGGDVLMIARLGQDHFAQQLRQALEDANVNTACVLNVAKPSGSAVILVTPQGGNSIVVIPGANQELRPADVDQHLDALRDASVILAQLEIPIDTIEHLAELAATLNIPFILDPAPAQPLSPNLLRNVTWLTPNESETTTLLQHLGYPSENLLTDDSISAASQHLLATGARNVILKLGSRGVFLSGKDVPPTRVAPYSVNAIDTTAAGDAFNGGFAYALTHAIPPIEAARFACAVAAISVTRAGAQPSMPRLAEVTALLTPDTPPPSTP